MSFRQNLILTIRLARQEIARIEIKMNMQDDCSREYDELQDEKNDLEMLISDFEDQLEDLLNSSTM
jgi:cell division protein FtsB